jgi:hypothetical protein
MRFSNVSYDELIESQSFHIVALFKIAFTKYLQAKRGKEINVTKYIIKIYEQKEIDPILQTLIFVNSFISKKIVVADNEEETQEMFNNFILKNFHYEKVKEELEKLEISVDNIESIVLVEEAEE